MIQTPLIVSSKLFGWKKLDTVKVYLGETDLCEDDAVKYDRKPQNHSIEKIIFHYAYDDINGLLNDVVILKLKDKIKFNDYIKPIALSKRSELIGFTNLEMISGLNLSYSMQIRFIPE